MVIPGDLIFCSITKLHHHFSGWYFFRSSCSCCHPCGKKAWKCWKADRGEKTSFSLSHNAISFCNPKNMNLWSLLNLFYFSFYHYLISQVVSRQFWRFCDTIECQVAPPILRKYTLTNWNCEVNSPNSWVILIHRNKRILILQ